MDFPIRDKELKKAYTDAFEQVHGTVPTKPLVHYSDISQELKYVEHQTIYTSAYHIGQRKLILNEIQFLTRIHPDEKAVVIYAGAAPSNKGAFLASLFPNLRFILIDPAEFDIRPYGYIEISYICNGDPSICARLMKLYIEEAHICVANMLMTSELATELRKQFDDTNIYFISDIRTNLSETSPDSLDIVWNSAQQVDWVTQMQPKMSMLKFRLPFYNESDDVLDEFIKKSESAALRESFDNTVNIVDFRKMIRSKEFRFYDGEILLQPWSPAGSTEARMVVTDSTKFRNYDPSEYANKFFYYNKILRNYQLYQNSNACKKIGFDYCADCALENVIWTDYCNSRYTLNKDELRKKVHEYVNILSQLTHRPLLDKLHGRLFSTLSRKEIMARFVKYQKSRKPYDPNNANNQPKKRG